LLRWTSAFDARLFGLCRGIGSSHRPIRLSLGGLALHLRILRRDGRRLWRLLRRRLRLLDTRIRLRLSLGRLLTQLRHLFRLARDCLGRRRSLDLIRLDRYLAFGSRGRLTLGRRFRFLFLFGELLHFWFRSFRLDGAKEILLLIRLRLELNRVVNGLDQRLSFDSRVSQFGELSPDATEDICLDRNNEQDQVNDDAEYSRELNAATNRTTLDLS
jgi:hypothetical protein